MNKLMARIVAVVMAVMMLGTVSFAAATATLSETNDVITPEIDDLTSGIYTVKAYTDTTNTIVAMYQGAKPGSVKIDPAKIDETDNNVVVEFNGKGGTKTTVNLPVTRKPAAEGDVISTVADTYKFGDKTYTGVAHIAHKFIPQAVATRIGYILSATGGTTTGAENVVAYEGDISGGLEVNFDVVVLNVPDGVTISAEYFIEY